MFNLQTAEEDELSLMFNLQTAEDGVSARRTTRHRKTCPDCGKVFTRLRRHLVLVHGMKPGSQELRAQIRRMREVIDTSMVTGMVNNHVF